MPSTVEIDCEVIHETDDAVLINDGDEDHWIPRSVIKDGDNVGFGDTMVEIMLWFAKKEGLI